MSNTAPADLIDKYLEVAGIVQRCQESLERLDADDPVRPNVEALLLLAEEEMEELAKDLPF